MLKTTEQKSLLKIEDSFKKIIFTKDTSTPTYSEDGVLIMNVYFFIKNTPKLPFCGVVFYGIT